MRKLLLTLRATVPGTLPVLAIVAAALLVAPPLRAQLDTTAGQPLPRDVRDTVVARWNGTNAIRTFDRIEIDEHTTIHGNVAVARSPLFVSGHVEGNVLVVNADLILRPGARVDGDLLVVGGDVEGRAAARIGGATRIYRPSLAFRESGDSIVATSQDASPNEERWWQRLERDRDASWAQALRVVQAGPYNRVEGLPIKLGPAVQQQTPWGSVRVDAAAVIRTASTFASSSDKADVGHDVRGEVRYGHNAGVGVGGRVYSVVDPVESWQLSDLETALAAFIAKRDYRDYYQRHGVNGSVTLFGQQNFSLTGSYGIERWSSRARHDPFSLFDGDDPWRINPEVDEGLMHLANATLKFDTRTDPDDPWSGWYASSDIEHGFGSLTSVAPRSTALAIVAPPAATQYTRGFFDVRRYTRLGPDAQLNLRVVLGGWLGGDPLPLERRLSVDGPGALPGFGFRAGIPSFDVGTCSDAATASVVGTPAECDRIALGQVEYRGDVKLPFTGGTYWPRQYHGAHGDVVWVLFADAGRGWRVPSSDAASITNMTYGIWAVPPLSTFRTDIGLGFDVSGVGIYAAKALSDPSRPVTFFLRLRHRI